MRKLIITFGACVALSLLGCSNGGGTATIDHHVEAAPTLTPLDCFVDSIFKTMPNALNNDVTRSMLADSIKVSLNNYQGGAIPFLSGLPLEYEMCLPYDRNSKFAGQYVVKFSYSDRATDKTTTFQVFTRMRKEEVANLVDHAKYQVDGVFLFFPDNTQEHWFELPSGKGFTDNPKIYTTTELDGSIKPFINLGSFIMGEVKFTRVE